MDTANLLAVLRRLALARPGPNLLHLPDDLSPHEAIQAVQAAITALERPTPVAPRSPAAVSGAVRVHIDGASRGNPGPAGIGVLFLGVDGVVLERLHRGIGEATNNVAEYSALLAALERAAVMGIRDLEVFSDSELLVRQLQGRYQVKHPALRPLYAYDAGFALSAGATLGILVGAGPLARSLGRVVSPRVPDLPFPARAPAGLAAATLCAEAIVLPITAFAFSQVTFAGRRSFPCSSILCASWICTWLVHASY